MTSFAIAFLLSAAVAAVVTPLLVRLALRHRLYDMPGRRKVHANPTPRIGGIAIVVAFFVPITGLLLVDAGATEALTGGSGHVAGLYLGAVLILGIGIYDDLKGANAPQKLIVQAAVAVTMFFFGFRIEAIADPFGGGVIEFGLFSLPITVFWFVGIINAVNLIDGLDGLAGGLGLICVVTLFVLSVMDGKVGVALMCASLGGALAGFLIFNFNPARIFMGDSGSMFVGFVLAAFSITSSAKGSTAIALVTPLLALGLPIFDTVLAIGRRMKRRRPVFSADRDHIHHKLLRAGLSHRQAVIALYVVAALLAGGALVMRVATDVTSGLVLMAAALFLFVLFRILSVRNPDVEDVIDPFAEHPSLDRARLRALARDIPGPPAHVQQSLAEMAVVTRLVAANIVRNDVVLFFWSRPVAARETVKGMKVYEIPLDDEGHAVLSIQHVDKGWNDSLGIIVAWELVADAISGTFAAHGWEPLEMPRPGTSNASDTHVAIRGLDLIASDKLIANHERV